jgi:hypothetical protein
MKKFFIGLLAVMFVAGAAYAGAPEVDFSGMINTRGQYFSNDDGITKDAATYMIYDMEFDADLKIKPNDKSFVFINWEMHDESWLATPGGSDDKGLKYDAKKDEYKLQNDDNIAIKRAYGSYTFDFGTQLDFGLMTGAAWANDWANTADGRYRLKFMHPTAMGPLFVILEKNLERGNTAVDDSDEEENDDSDAYYVAMVTKAGDIAVKPLLGYVVFGETPGGKGDLEDDGADIIMTFIDVGFDGSFGAIGFSAEVAYQNWDQQFSGGETYSLMGVFADVWTNLDALKVGGILAYGSWDDDAGAGFGFGEDFTPTIGGADGFTVGNSSKSEYNAVTFLQVYVGYALSETMDVTGKIAYWMSNANENADGSDNFWKDANGMEFDAYFNWKLADNVKWQAGLGTGQINLDEDAATYDDADAYTRFYHKITVSF